MIKFERVNMNIYKAEQMSDMEKAMVDRGSGSSCFLWRIQLSSVRLWDDEAELLSCHDSLIPIFGVQSSAAQNSTSLQSFQFSCSNSFHTELLSAGHEF